MSRKPFSRQKYAIVKNKLARAGYRIAKATGGRRGRRGALGVTVQKIMAKVLP